jgi:phosphate/sulfate permease
VELPVSALHILLGSIIGVGLADSMQVRIWYRMECRHTLLTPKCQGDSKGKWTKIVHPDV